MSSDATPRGFAMPPRLLPRLLITLLAVALLWALVLGWWQATDHAPQRSEMLLHLIVLPLALVGGFWLLRGFIDHLRAPLPAATEAPAGEAAASAGAGQDEAETRLRLALLAGTLCCAGGGDAAELVDAVRAGRRPPLDDALLDPAGYPIHAARVAGMDADAEAVRAQLSERAGAEPQGAFQVELERALALLAKTLAPAWASTLELVDKACEDATVRLLWLQPANWPESLRPLLGEWLLATCCVGLAQERVRLTTRAVASDAEALAAVDEVIVALQRAPSSLCLVIGAVSHLGPDTLLAWHSAGRLLRADAHHGRIPGEAAAVVLLAQEALAARCSDAPGGVSIGRVAHARRDAPGRAGDVTLGELIDRTLRAAAIEPASVALVAADTDHRAGAQRELMGQLGERFEALDPLNDCPALGTACGSVEPIGALLALLCAADACRSAERPALCLSTEHERVRAAIAAITTPPAIEAPAGAA